MKYVYTLLSLAMMAFVSVACTETLPSDDPDTEATFDAPAHLNEAVKMTVTTPESIYKSLEMTESGLYIIRTKDDLLMLGDYRFNQPTYTCQNFGDVEVIEAVTRADKVETVPSRITIRRTGESPVTVDVTVVKGSSTTDSGTLDKLCRTWVPQKTIISVTGGSLPASLGVAHAETGCDLPGILSYLAGNGLELDVDLSGYVVKDVTFTRAGTFLIRFSGADPYEGEYQLNADCFFRYTLDGAQIGNPLINASAEGNVGFEKADGKSVCEITLRSQVDADAGYVGKIILRLIEK